MIEILPVVEFFVEDDVSDDDVEKLLGTESRLDGTNNNEWRSNDGNAQTLRLNSEENTDPFTTDLLNEVIMPFKFAS